MTGTILVTDKVRRTLKFICAISRSVPIVSEQWISASIANNKFVDTNKYILNDKAAEAKFGFNLQQSLIKSKDNKLLHNTTFIITTGVNQPSVNELKSNKLYFRFLLHNNLLISVNLSIYQLLQI